MRERGWLIAALALVVYSLLAPHHVVDGDNAEFATLGALGGAAHPSGYPLYVLWLRAWSWLPVSPAYTAALATAVLGALALGVLHAACRAWGARPAAASIAVAVIGAAPIVLRYHSQAEAFAMNDLVAALVLWLSAERGPLRGRWRGVALGLVAGLGLADHLTCALLAPIGLFGAVRAVRESSVATVGLAIGGLAIGLLPYGYLLVADGPASWGQVSTVSELVGFVLRREYGGSTRFDLDGHDVAWTASVAACAMTIARSWLWLGALAGAAMLVVRIRRPAGESRWAWALLAASVVLAGPLLAVRFNVEPSDIGLYVVQRFHVLPALLLTIPVAAAIDLAAARWQRTGAAQALAAIAFVVLALAAAPGLARVRSPAMELGARNLLRALPPAAIVVVSADDQCFGARYLQLARGERPDVTTICSGLIPARWYRARVLDIPPTTGPSLAAALLATGRPVFVDPTLTRILAAYPSYPFAVVMRVLPIGERPPRAADIAAINRDLYRAFDLDYARPGRGDEYAAIVHHRYAASWAAIARRLDAEGDRAGALEAFELTRTYQPTDD